MKIIINALSGIGDAVMFSPALSLLKKHLPDSEIEMIVMFKAVGEIYRRNANLSKVHFIDFLNQSAYKSFKDVRALSKNGYDASINVYPSNRREYNIINYLLGANKRIAKKYNHYSSGNFDFLNNLHSPEIKDRHNVLQNFDLVKFLIPNANENELGGLEIPLTFEDNHKASEYLVENKLSGMPLIGFHAGSATFKGHINKRWASEKFAELSKKLSKDFGAKVLLFGTESDVNDRILELSEGAAFIPKTYDVMQSISLMSKCKLFVSNDSALMHVAAALKTPTVAIFGYTNHKELAPWQNKNVIVRHELECSPCFFNSPKPVNCIYKNTGDAFKCIRQISVDEVFEACKSLLDSH